MEWLGLLGGGGGGGIGGLMGTSSATASSGPLTINSGDRALTWGLGIVAAGLVIALILLLRRK